MEKTLYGTLTKRYDLAKVQEAKEISVIKVLDALNIPERKSTLHRLMIAFEALGFHSLRGSHGLLRPGLGNGLTAPTQQRRSQGYF